MKRSLFFDFTASVYPVIRKYIEMVNGKRKAPSYLFEEMLRKEFSPTQKWDSANVNTTYVAADIVDINSPLPVKRRDSISRANGNLPNMGMKLKLNASDINNINIMVAQGVLTQEVTNKLLNDSVRCANGIKERIESCLLQALSEGVYAVDNEDNVGTAMRLDFGFLPGNCYGAVKPWGEEGATPLTDMARVLGNHSDIKYVMLSKQAYNLLRRSDEAKSLVAAYTGATIVDIKNYPTPTPSNFNEAMTDEYGIEFIIVDRTVYIERNGSRTPTRPWNDNKVTFLVEKQVGALVYGQHPEETNPVEGVQYAKPLEYALLSKYSKNDPLEEFTAIQGIVAPILENVDQIYSLDIASSEVVDDNKEKQDTSDLKLTVWGQTYTKSEVIKALGTITGSRLPHNISDEKLVAKINELSDDEEARLKEALEAHKA